VLRGIFGPKRDEVIGGWKKLHNEELHNLYSKPSIIRLINVARMGRSGMHRGFWWESQKERDHWEDLDVGGRIRTTQLHGVSQYLNVHRQVV
jgi:hypothetical protein